jgi:hypothetical protein
MKDSAFTAVVITIPIPAAKAAAATTATQILFFTTLTTIQLEHLFIIQPNETKVK